jgi:hypothetical protein
VVILEQMRSLKKSEVVEVAADAHTPILHPVEIS